MEPAEGETKRDCWTVAFGEALLPCMHTVYTGKLAIIYLWEVWLAIGKLGAVLERKGILGSHYPGGRGDPM